LALEDRPDLERLPVRVEPGLIEGVLEAQAHPERKPADLREADTRSNVPAGELRPLARHVRRGLEIEAGLEILRPAVRDLEREMKLPMIGENALFHRFRSARRKVRVELQHRAAGFDGVVRIHLNLEEILRGHWRRTRRGAHHQQTESSSEESARQSWLVVRFSGASGGTAAWLPLRYLSNQ